MVNYKILFYNRNKRLYERYSILYRYYDLKGNICYAWLNNCHSWLYKLPLIDKDLICRDCGIVTKIGNYDIKRCEIRRYRDKFW